MDWQELTALAVVLATVAVFARRLFRPRPAGCHEADGCGCGAAKSPPRESVVFRARRGERPQIIVKRHRENFAPPGRRPAEAAGPGPDIQ